MAFVAVFVVAGGAGEKVLGLVVGGAVDVRAEGVLVLAGALEHVAAGEDGADVEPQPVEGAHRERLDVLAGEDGVEVHRAGARRVLKERVAVVPGEAGVQVGAIARRERGVDLGLGASEGLARGLLQPVEQGEQLGLVRKTGSTADPRRGTIARAELE